MARKTNKFKFGGLCFRRLAAGFGMVLAIGSWNPTAAPAAAAQSDQSDLSDKSELSGAIQRGVGFLLKTQNPDGSWGSARHTKALNIYAPVPGAHGAFRAAVTAMCVSALIETGAADGDGPAEAALERGEHWLLENLSGVRRATAAAIYNVWAHAYGLQALAHMHDRHTGEPDKMAEIDLLIENQIERLQRYASVDGGWGYYDFRAGTKRPSASPNSFTTATGLVALHAAAATGAEVPDKLVSMALATVQRQRKPDGSFLYGEYLRKSPMRGINRPGGSLGRTMACYIALRQWGDESITDEAISRWLDRLFTRNGWLDIGRKRPVPHEAWFQVAGYFFYYGHYYAALCIEALPAAAAAPHQKKLGDLLVGLQESDGSWWDFPFYSYHQPYGTAFALMALARCR